MTDACKSSHCSRGDGVTATAWNLAAPALRGDEQYLEAPNQVDSKREPIGSARQLQDGTLMLRLTNDGALIEQRILYKKDNPAYNRIACHIGPIKPGESKPLLPFETDEPNDERSNSIGVARINTDGTITITTRTSKVDHYRSETLTYPPSNSYYKTVLNHIWGIEPGIARQVVAWHD